jgi:hypothetical protein
MNDYDKLMAQARYAQFDAIGPETQDALQELGFGSATRGQAQLSSALLHFIQAMIVCGVKTNDWNYVCEGLAMLERVIASLPHYQGA